MQRVKRPAKSPQKQIRLPLDGVDIREETRHQGGSREQRQHDEILVDQRFSRPPTHTSLSLLSKCNRSKCVHHPNRRVTFGTNPCRQHSGFAQNKVLAIMEHRIFQKQPYLDTGNQKITEPLSASWEHRRTYRNMAKLRQYRQLNVSPRPSTRASFLTPLSARQGHHSAAHFMIGSGHSKGVLLAWLLCQAQLPPLKASSPGKGEIS